MHVLSPQATGGQGEGEGWLGGCGALPASCWQPQVTGQAANEHPGGQPLVEAVEELSGAAVTGEAVERSNEEEEEEQVLGRERHRGVGIGWC